MFKSRTTSFSKGDNNKQYISDIYKSSSELLLNQFQPIWEKISLGKGDSIFFKNHADNSKIGGKNFNAILLASCLPFDLAYCWFKSTICSFWNMWNWLQYETCFVLVTKIVFFTFFCSRLSSWKYFWIEPAGQTIVNLIQDWLF